MLGPAAVRRDDYRFRRSSVPGAKPVNNSPSATPSPMSHDSCPQLVFREHSNTVMRHGKQRMVFVSSPLRCNVTRVRLLGGVMRRVTRTRVTLQGDSVPTAELRSPNGGAIAKSSTTRLTYRRPRSSSTDGVESIVNNPIKTQAGATTVHHPPCPDNEMPMPPTSRAVPGPTRRLVVRETRRHIYC